MQEGNVTADSERRPVREYHHPYRYIDTAIGRALGPAFRFAPGTALGERASLSARRWASDHS